MKNLLSPAFLGLAERTARTFAQSLLAMIAGVQGGLLHVPWTASLSVAGLAALACLLNGIVAPAQVTTPAPAAPVAAEQPAAA